MALLISPGTRVADASGNPIAGKVRVYNANTTTLSTLWSDAALSVPLTNPVTCNSAGYPSSNGTAACGIFCASANYDIAFLDASSVVMATIDDVASYSSSGTGVEITLAGGTRYTVTDSAGRVLIQVGDASPDNVGGKLTIEGYAGTQGDDLLLDFAAIDTTGTIKEGGKRLSGVVATEATTLAAATTNIIPLPNSPAGCRAWRVDFFDLTSSAGTVIVISVQLSFDGGVTYKSTNEYNGWMWGRDQAGPGVAEAVVSAAVSGQIAQVNSNTNKLVWGTLEILSPLGASSSDATIIRGDVVGMNKEATNKAVRYLSNVICQSASQGRPTHVKLLANSGNIDCKYRVEPSRGWGET